MPKTKTEIKSTAEVVDEAANSGESAGTLLAEYVREMLDDDDVTFGTIVADMDNVIEWAKLIRLAARIQDGEVDRG